MRPLALRLEGFLSWREPTVIDLRDVTAGVLVGENGAGKTSVVEAMGWALFGKGRARSPDAYVSAGEMRAEVRLEFELRGTKYRVARERSLASGGKSNLHLLANRGDETWAAVGGDHIVETQAAIEELLGLDYETWLATSFVGQGKADQFTTLRPRERKALLADVLQLGIYEHLADTAREQERRTAGEHSTLSTRIEELEAFLAGREEAENSLRTMEAKETEWQTKADEAEKAVGEQEEALGALLHDQALLDRKRDRLEALAKERLAERTRVTDELTTVAKDRAELELEIERESKRARAADAEAKKADQLATEAVKLERLADDAAKAQEISGRGQERRRSAIEDLGEKATALNVEEAEIEERLAAIARSGATCWTCGQELAAGIPEKVRADLEHRLMEIREYRTNISAAMEEHQRIIAELQAQKIPDPDALRRSAQAKAVEAERAKAQAWVAEEAGQRIHTARAKLAEKDARSKELQAAYRALMEPSLEEEALRSEIEEAAGKVAEVEAARARLDAAKDEARTALRILNEAVAARARAEEFAKRFDEAQVELEKTILLRDGAASYGQKLGLLAEAFGKDGIPALIVENAVPQVEEEANRLLGRLTDGRFRVAIESLRAKKTGGLKETLDIVVSDGTDERPLEELSGGERQSVDIALRVGLARLLARRAGRPIECLILDEAFTALDSGRRQRAIEVLHTLTEEFPLVLFVTHLQDMADAFPTALRVVREDGTSRLEVAA